MSETYSLIPKQAFLLFPDGRDLYYEQKHMIKRSIFGDGRYPEYTEIQKQKISDFIQLAKKDNEAKLILNESQLTVIIKMIYANKYDLEKALANYKDYKKWANQFVPLHSIDPQYKQRMDDLLKTGIFYASPTRDQFFKPMMIVHVGRILRVKPDQKLFLDTFGYFLQTCIETMMIDGQLETWNVIVDVDQTSVFSFAGALFDLIKFLSRIFIGRMYRCYIVDYPFLIKFVWGTVSLMMDAQQNQKCRILTKEEMIQLIPKQTLQQKYGGDLAPFESFWPLDTPQRVRIQKQTQQKMRKYWYKHNKLVSEEQYYQRAKRDKIGNKKCIQIINYFDTIEQNKENERIRIENAKPVKLSIEEIKFFSSKIKIQKQPMHFRIVDDPKPLLELNECNAVQKGESEETFVGKQEFLTQNQTVQNHLHVRRSIFQKLTFKSIFQ